jgi:sulfide:quinone oxidoreductase
MDVRTVTETLSVSLQLSPGDVDQAADQGFRSIICNRPDGESPDQPPYAVIAAAAEAAGLEVRSIPVRGGAIDAESVRAFDQALAALPKPILAYCRSGTRSITLWALTQAGRRPPREIVLHAQAAGYDVSGAIQSMAGA